MSGGMDGFCRKAAQTRQLLICSAAAVHSDDENHPAHVASDGTVSCAIRGVTHSEDEVVFGDLINGRVLNKYRVAQIQGQQNVIALLGDTNVPQPGEAKVADVEPIPVILEIGDNVFADRF